MIESILLGVLAGVGYGITGYAKHIRRGKLEKFDPYKFGQSVIVGGIVGGISGAMGISLETTHQFFLNIGGVTLVENLKKFFVRKFLQ